MTARMPRTTCIACTTGKTRPLCVATSRRTLAVFLSTSVVVVSLLTVGCSGENEWVAGDDDPLELVDIDAEMGARRISLAAAAEQEFVPPNPGRKNPFHYHGDFATNGGPSYTGQLSQIEVRGFASAGGSAVILAMNGETQTLRVGDSVAGVEVLKIAPPLVTLRAGTSEWTASMFETANSRRLQN